MIASIFWMVTAIDNATEERSGSDSHGWSGFSVALHIFLPVAGLALLWGRRDILSKLLLQLDRSCISVFCPSFSKREKLLKWARSRLPITWSSQAKTLGSGVLELWRDGSLLCTLINSVVPGACPNPHRHWRKPPTHALALAYKYLGVPPMFTEPEICGELTINHERNFIHYLHELQKAINKWPASEDANHKYSSQYVARGMGLYTGEQYQKTVFYVYSNLGAKRPGNILMYIRGPYGSHGKATIPPFNNPKTIPTINFLQHQLNATRVPPLKTDAKKSFLKTISLDFSVLIKGTESNTVEDDIPIQIDMELERAKVTYIPSHDGMYEISLISDGEMVKGSPFSVHILKNASNERSTFDTMEKLEDRMTLTKRKVVSKIIDCINEKISIDDNRVTKVCATSNHVTSRRKRENDRLTNSLVGDSDNKKNDEGIVDDNKTIKTEITCKVEPEVLTEKDLDDKKSEMGVIIEDIEKETSVSNDEQNVSPASCIAESVVQPTDGSAIIYHEPNPKFNSKLLLDPVERTKHLKNIVNSNNKEGTDSNHRKSPQFNRLQTSKIYIELDTPSVPQPKNSLQTSTSPICPGHIVPEVMVKGSYNELSLSDKRRVFSKQKRLSLSPAESSSFSGCENDHGCKINNPTFRELSVLNVLDTIKQSRKNSYSDSYFLSGTSSLPDMTSLETFSDISFKNRRDYWERKSLSSSSSASLVNSDFTQGKKFSVNNRNLFNDCSKNVVKYSDNSEERKEGTKSVNDVISLDYECVSPQHKKYKSVDGSLEDCCRLSIEERKKILLRDHYEKEQLAAKSIKKPVQDNNNATQSKTVSVKIQQFVEAHEKPPRLSNFIKNDITETSTNANNLAGTDSTETKKKSPLESIKSPFKRAIKYFKNLEENSKIKTGMLDGKKRLLTRRYSLDFQSKNNRNAKQGGSLNLPHTSERFSIHNLYEDILGNRRGLFKGTPNTHAVVTTLASLAKSSDSTNCLKEEDENIKYNLFVSKAKSKKRKSIKTLFDVNY